MRIGVFIDRNRKPRTVVYRVTVCRCFMRERDHQKFHKLLAYLQLSEEVLMPAINDFPLNAIMQLMFQQDGAPAKTKSRSRRLSECSVWLARS
ncbi:hypothetical protein J6590_022900 [Homalodisca vitripennis]|nr:hypothetical protein J6590_022900 [Homalodisca vitripennis]